MYSNKSFSSIHSINTRCNNCGKKGHVFNSCKLPITSLGIICFKKNNESKETEILMIRRKDTLGFVDFMRGRYELNNVSHIQLLVDEMTLQEKQLLVTRTYDELWNHLWGTSKLSKKYLKERELSESLFNSLVHGVVKDEVTYTLETFVSNSTTKWTEPEWGFPKGRRNNNERDLQSAQREFQEETGISSSNLRLIHNLLPLEEIFTGSNYKSYEHKYYLSGIDIGNNEYDLTRFQSSEVSDLKWIPIDDAHRYIRDYCYERKNIIKQVKKIIDNYRLI
jgi:ADP-ribose pyrophosphatase YjhB (NUDIX family)